MNKLLTVGTALGFLFVLSTTQNAEARRTYFSFQLGGPTYVAPPVPYYVAPQPYYVSPTYVVPQYYYPTPPCYRVPQYTPWGVVY